MAGGEVDAVACSVEDEEVAGGTEATPTPIIVALRGGPPVPAIVDPRVAPGMPPAGDIDLAPATVGGVDACGVAAC